MLSNPQRYPFSSPDGTPIPLDVIKPYSVIRKTFSSSASGNIAVPSEVEVASFIATEDCWIKFGGAASVPADGVAVVDMLFIRKNLRVTAALPAATFSVIRDTIDGVLTVQFLGKWVGLALETQYQRR